MISGKVFVLSLKVCFEISHVNRASYGHADGQANCGALGYKNFFSFTSQLPKFLVGCFVLDGSGLPSFWHQQVLFFLKFTSYFSLLA